VAAAPVRARLGGQRLGFRLRIVQRRVGVCFRGNHPAGLPAAAPRAPYRLCGRSGCPLHSGRDRQLQLDHRRNHHHRGNLGRRRHQLHGHHRQRLDAFDHGHVRTRQCLELRRIARFHLHGDHHRQRRIDGPRVGHVQLHLLRLGHHRCLRRRGNHQLHLHCRRHQQRQRLGHRKL
jgi:hypothetical protein